MMIPLERSLDERLLSRRYEKVDLIRFGWCWRRPRKEAGWEGRGRKGIDPEENLLPSWHLSTRYIYRHLDRNAKWWCKAMHKYSNVTAVIADWILDREKHQPFDGSLLLNSCIIVNLRFVRFGRRGRGWRLLSRVLWCLEKSMRDVCSGYHAQQSEGGWRCTGDEPPYSRKLMEWLHGAGS